MDATPVTGSKAVPVNRAPDRTEEPGTNSVTAVGAVVSTVTVPLAALVAPVQAAPSVASSEYRQRPSGAARSSHAVVVSRPAQVPPDGRDAPVTASSTRTTYPPTGRPSG
jgi:hypothetical protein